MSGRPSPDLGTAPTLMRDPHEMAREFVAEQLAFEATQVACARMFLDIADDAGAIYALDKAKVHMRAALEVIGKIKRDRGAAMQAKEAERVAVEAARQA